MVKTLLFLLLTLSIGFNAKATHVMGGEITWKCNGNGYVFQLTFYRDCNGVDVNPVSENLRVWNHPSVSNIPLVFLNRTDISPSCSPVAGSPSPLLCGSGPNSGNGIGAIEKIIYQSNPIVLSGIPPAGGWIFTYENFSRSNLISNLNNPTNYGITITAKMFAAPNAVAGTCIDNSPQFLQDPYLVSCAGEEYSYNLHPVDIDRDSVVVSFGTPLNNFPSGTYNPPTNPNNIPYEPGFSPTNPTPDASFQAGNIPANLNTQTGQLTFTSLTTGSFVVKIVAQSYRQGVLIAEVEREMQLIIKNCGGVNTAPTIAGPFAGLFETTVNAGDLVNFTLSSTDPELLQDGSPQSNTLSVTSLQFGANFTSAAGCLNPPCATLNQTPSITGIQGVSTDFSWQTDCSHLLDVNGVSRTEITYNFVFKVQDNYCDIPKTTYKTISIHVKNPGIIPATKISCIHTETNGDVTITWDPVVDPFGSFVNYELYSVQNGLIGTFPIGTTSTVVPNPGAKKDFYLSVVSGCNEKRNTDTLSNVFLTLFNPANGVAQLSWNLPSPSLPNGMLPTADIQREYPTGTWTSIGNVPYGVTNFKDTIDICSAFLNYQIIYTTPTCTWNSNVVGDDFEDLITPDLPIISSVSVDTLTGNLVITWNQNYQPDTKGYVIYIKDPNGFIVEIDTVYGIGTTTYSYSPSITGPLSYSVAAFDSCFTTNTPPTYQTSGKADLHTIMYVDFSINSCNAQVALNWTPYEGWLTELDDYTIFVKEGSSPWVIYTSTSANNLTLNLLPLKNYCVVIRANKLDGTESFSNKICFTVNAPNPPAIHYLRLATVSQNGVDLIHEITPGSNVQAILFEKYNPRNNQFEELVTLGVGTGTVTYTDTEVDVNHVSYTYRARYIDSCGGKGPVSNVARTVLLKIRTDQQGFKNLLSWNAYTEFDGGVLEYQLYRGFDGVFESTPFVTLPANQFFYEDDLSVYGYDYSGKICYFVVAHEAHDQYNFEEYSLSNSVCGVLEPLVYIPNAFTPEGLNPIFIPVVTFQDVNKYEFSVLDRWGQLIFQTQDTNEGWNGNNRFDKLVELGTYVYVVKVVDGNNQEYMFRGTVTVVR